MKCSLLVQILGKNVLSEDEEVEVAKLTKIVHIVVSIKNLFRFNLHMASTVLNTCHGVHNVEVLQESVVDGNTLATLYAQNVHCMSIF